jgi:hypothetical protein
MYRLLLSAATLLALRVYVCADLEQAERARLSLEACLRPADLALSGAALFRKLELTSKRVGGFSIESENPFLFERVKNGGNALLLWVTLPSYSESDAGFRALYICWPAKTRVTLTRVHGLNGSRPILGDWALVGGKLMGVGIEGGSMHPCAGAVSYVLKGDRWQLFKSLDTEEEAAVEDYSSYVVPVLPPRVVLFTREDGNQPTPEAGPWLTRETVWTLGPLGFRTKKTWIYPNAYRSFVDLTQALETHDRRALWRLVPDQRMRRRLLHLNLYGCRYTDGDQGEAGQVFGFRRLAPTEDHWFKVGPDVVFGRTHKGWKVVELR